jgi:nitrogen fixation NifU-like protein
MDLKELYRDVILDHNKHPRNFGRLDPADAQADGHNPLCGDRLSVFVKMDGDRIADLKFEGKGCAISTKAAIGELFGKVHSLLTQQEAPAGTELGKLAALQGVREFPSRVKCASLCWHTLNAALDRGASTVSTE